MEMQNTSYLYQNAQADQPHRSDPLHGRDGPGPGRAALDPERAVLQRLCRAGLEHVHPVDRRPAPRGGGLANAIFGSLLIVGFTVLIATPIGIFAGVYLAEYGDQSKTAELTRFVTDIMLSAPRSCWACSSTPSSSPDRPFLGLGRHHRAVLIAIPVMVRTTENMLRLVPPTLRRLPSAWVRRAGRSPPFITLRAAKSGVVTGLLLAIARISGETAPLLFTALNKPVLQLGHGQPIANLPVVIYQFAMSPYDNWVRLAWGGALLITLTVLVLNIVARVFFRENGCPERSPPSAQNSPGFILQRDPITQATIRGKLRNAIEVATSTSTRQGFQGPRTSTSTIAENKVDGVHRPVGLRQVHAARTLNRMYSLYPGQRAGGRNQLLRPEHPRPQAGPPACCAPIGMVFEAHAVPDDDL